MKRPGDLTSPIWIYAKAAGFLLVGLMSSLLILMQLPRWDVAFYPAVSIWAFARAYYFAFYVIEHYIDPEFQYRGIIDLLYYFRGKKRHK